MPYELIFKGEQNDPTQLTVAVVNSRIDIMLYDPTCDEQQNCTSIYLDKDTAIKFAKELRKQISFLED
jgi:exosome complex RNA-binding protein Rrp42 (RNase PH superfamily)